MVRHKEEDRLSQKFLKGLAGDQRSYHEFLSELTILLRKYARRQLVRLGRGESEAEDIVQETLMAIHQRRHTFVKDLPVTAWAHAIARYKMIDFLRAKKSDIRLVSLEETSTSVENYFDGLEAKISVNRFLSDLPEHFRKPIALTKLYGFSIQETAKYLKKSEATIKVNIHRGMKALSTLMGKTK